MDSFRAYTILATIYVLSILGINLITFLISDFYRKKFSQPSPRLGFLISIVFGILCVGSVFFWGNTSQIARTAGFYLLLGCSIFSIYSTISLHFTMKKIRK